ncbi:oxidoreductase [Marinomonas sp. S3726]|uniref:oxidoreductase n=1 Tax=Marinomonas sp. S3726 TaxID=579484 RepID=UPI0005FA2F1E|nr:oxidoreductase [Marinomonas sp. S3726]KJZ15135.1 oxidoreductase [Marinomonas sp. S3726]
MSIKTAIVGYGFSSKTFHIPFITTTDAFRFVAVSSSKKDAVLADWPEVSHYQSADEMIVNTEADLIIITAPNDVHYALAKLALENGKHVLIEKPFVTRSQDGEALIKLAKEKGLLLSVYQNRRYDGDFLTVKRLIEEEKLGEVRVYESHFDRFRPNVQQRWREVATDGGGILYDLAPHLLDQVITLFGLPQSLSASCKVMRKGGSTTDYFHLTLHYPEREVILVANLFCSGPNLRFQVQGDKASYLKYGLDPQEDCLRAGELPLGDNWGAEKLTEFGKLYDDENVELIPTEKGCYQNFFADLAKAISTGDFDPMGAEQSLNSIRLIELALESEAQGQRLDVNF